MLSLKLIKLPSSSTFLPPWGGVVGDGEGVANVPCDTNQLDFFRGIDTPRVCTHIHKVEARLQWPPTPRVHYYLKRYQKHYYYAHCYYLCDGHSRSGKC